jgi:hypothetical protein
MTTRTRPFVHRSSYAAALLVVLGGLGPASSPGLAQGSMVVTITAPEQNATVAGTTTVRASVSSGLAVAGVQFQLDGVNLGAEDTSAPYSIPWDTTTTSNNLHTLTAVARDVAGVRHSSSPVCVTVANGVPSETRFEETDLATAYTVGWIHRVGDAPFSGGTAAYSPQTDGRATFTFVGTAVKWIGYRGPQTGIALVFLDGNMVAQVDTYSPVEEARAIIFSADGLQHGRHTLWIEVTGLKNPASWSSIVIVDAFDVAPASPPPVFRSGKRLEETNAAVAYTTGWSQGDRSSAWSGGTAATSETAGARVTVSFTGTSLEWIGSRGPAAGIARVFVDGVYQGEVDLYEPRRLQAVVYSRSGLEQGAHTLVIEATGLRNAASLGAAVAVDAFDTRTRIEHDHPGVVFVDYWEETVSRAWSDRTAVYTWVATARATLTFSGTSIRWIGYRGPMGGIARLFLDGTFVGAIDTYAAEETVQGIVYEAAGLAAGSHTLRIEVTGEMHPLAQKPFIAIDAFDVNF